MATAWKAITASVKKRVKGFTEYPYVLMGTPSKGKTTTESDYWLHCMPIFIAKGPNSKALEDFFQKEGPFTLSQYVPIDGKDRGLDGTGEFMYYATHTTAYYNTILLGLYKFAVNEIYPVEDQYMREMKKAKPDLDLIFNLKQIAFLHCLLYLQQCQRFLVLYNAWLDNEIWSDDECATTILFQTPTYVAQFCGELAKELLDTCDFDIVGQPSPEEILSMSKLSLEKVPDWCDLIIRQLRQAEGEYDHAYIDWSTIILPSSGKPAGPKQTVTFVEKKKQQKAHSAEKKKPKKSGTKKKAKAAGPAKKKVKKSKQAAMKKATGAGKKKKAVSTTKKKKTVVKKKAVVKKKSVVAAKKKAKPAAGGKKKKAASSAQSRKNKTAVKAKKASRAGAKKKK